MALVKPLKATLITLEEMTLLMEEVMKAKHDLLRFGEPPPLEFTLAAKKARDKMCRKDIPMVCRFLHGRVFKTNYNHAFGDPLVAVYEIFYHFKEEALLVLNEILYYRDYCSSVKTIAAYTLIRLANENTTSDEIINGLVYQRKRWEYGEDILVDLLQYANSLSPYVIKQLVLIFEEGFLQFEVIGLVKNNNPDLAKELTHRILQKWDEKDKQSTSHPKHWEQQEIEHTFIIAGFWPDHPWTHQRFAAFITHALTSADYTHSLLLFQAIFKRRLSTFYPFKKELKSFLTIELYKTDDPRGNFWQIKEEVVFMAHQLFPADEEILEQVYTIYQEGIAQVEAEKYINHYLNSLSN